MHASENKEEAEHETSHWFSQEDIFTYKRSDHTVMYNE